MSTKNYLRLSIGINVAFVLFFAVKRLYYSQTVFFPQTAAVDFADQNDYLRNDIFFVLPIDSGSIVFVGNSLTERSPVDELFPGLKVVNRGVGSNRTEHVLRRLDSILKYKPAKIVLEIGVNDLDYGASADSTMRNMVRIIGKIHCPVIVQSVFPEKSKLDKLIRELNSKLKKYCLQNGLTFVDVYTPLVQGDHLNDLYTIDGTHLNGAGMIRWREVLGPYLRGQ